MSKLHTARKMGSSISFCNLICSSYRFNEHSKLLSLSSRALVKRLAVVFELSQMRLKGLFKLSAVMLHVLLFLNLAVMDFFHMFSLSMATKLGAASSQTCLKPDSSLTVPSLKDTFRWNVPSAQLQFRMPAHFSVELRIRQ